MNRIFTGLLKKAGIFACLFAFTTLPAFSQGDWIFSPANQRSYASVLDLESSHLRNLDEGSPEALYIASLAETLELLITEDASLYSRYEDRYEERLDSKLSAPDPVVQFIQAEIRLQWAFVYLKFGQEFDAALNLKNAWEIAEQCRKKYPDFTPIRKTTGLLEVMFGSVPEKYNWVLSLLGMKGSVARGLSDLQVAMRSRSSVAFEADVLYALVHGFILQEPEPGLKKIEELLASEPSNKLLSFLAAALAIKNSASEKALNHIHRVIPSPQGINLFYADYLRGEVHLHKADYRSAIRSYELFIKNYRGQNFIKDALYKIGLSYWLDGKKDSAHLFFDEARSKGKEYAEADKYAARSLAEDELPNIPLSKSRYFTDGGYYALANAVLDSIKPSDIPTKRDQTEYYYRKARLAHKQNQPNAARLFYRQTIDMSESEHWYFAPNASLQLGYIAVAENDLNEAKTYFKKALSYKKHEYKNSIDSKARTALAQIRRR